MSHRLAAIAALVVVCVIAAACVPSLAQQRAKFLEENPLTAPDVRQAILEERVIMGMTEREVVAAIGYPNDINRDTYSFGTRAQFCYDSGSIYFRPKYTYVYFENGRVTSWSQ